MRRLAVIALLVACKAHHDGPPKLGSAAVDPWSAAAPPLADAAPETPAARQKRVEVALERVSRIMPKLAVLRELAFDHDIERAYQTPEGLRAFAHAEIEKDLPASIAVDRSAALFHIGLLTKPGNLAELEERAFTSQGGSYYDVTTKKFFLVSAPDNDMLLDAFSVHELTHGLQDQHFDLQKFLPDGDAIDADHVSAHRFVAEGDATFTMFVFMLGQMTGKKFGPENVTMLRAQLDQFLAMSPADLAKHDLFGFSASMDSPLEGSRDAIAELPMTVVVPMFAAYLHGAQVAAIAYQRGGWKAVDALYRDPPESTEQVLHPEAKLFPAREHPKKVTLGKPTQPEVLNLVMGELQWQIYFAQWLPAQKAIASAGWGGDRVSVVKRGDGRYVARIVTVWDTVKDADEFRAAYAASLTQRFTHGMGDPGSPLGFDRGDGKIFLAQDGAKVVIVDGGDDAGELANLAASTRIE